MGPLADVSAAAAATEAAAAAAVSAPCRLPSESAAEPLFRALAALFVTTVCGFLASSHDRRSEEERDTAVGGVVWVV